MRINNRLYQIKTNNRCSEIQRSIALNTQKNDFMNLKTYKIDKRKCYNYKKKSHIAKRYKKLKLIQQLDTLKEDLDQKDRELF